MNSPVQEVLNKGFLPPLEGDIPPSEMSNKDKFYDFEVMDSMGRAIKFSGLYLGGYFGDGSIDTMEGISLDLELYKTNMGHFICERRIIDDEDEGCPDAVWELVETEEDVISFFGQGWVAHKLYQSVGIDNHEQLSITGVDFSKNDYDEIVVKRDNKSSLKFFGKSIAKTVYQQQYDYGNVQELELFILPNGQFVCVNIVYSSAFDELDNYNAEVVNSYAEVKSFFKFLLDSDSAVAWGKKLQQHVNDGIKYNGEYSKSAKE